MTKQIIRLAQCPFCDEAGEVYLDIREADAAHLRQIREQEFHAGPDQRIILYDSDKDKSGPCEHLADLYGDLSWDGRPIESLA